MKKQLIIVFCIFIMVITTFSGCTENKQNQPQGFEGITIESDIVELVYAEKDFVRDDQGIILRAEVQYRFHVIAGRDVNFTVTADFYDKNNSLIYSSSPPMEFSLPDGYTEVGVGPANKISYEGKNLTEIDHVVIKAIEIFS